jgi:hypothetical protein
MNSAIFGPKGQIYFLAAYSVFYIENQLDWDNY